ncbi:MAG: NAD(P)-binding domain-containing protein [Thermoanaerobaculia bacterium]|nr:NAD(P)-binding domain-containing protein [Thermoanaerobaculia bacterium]
MTEANAQTFEYLILGAGPAGLQMGYFLQRAGRSYAILEAGERPGTFFERFPRHRMLISINKVHTGYQDPEINLRFDWNSLLCDDPEFRFKEYSRDYFPGADVLVRYLGDFAERHGLEVRCGVRATRVSRRSPDQPFRVEDQRGQVYVAERLLVATGFGGSNVPKVPGIELAESYWDVSVNPEDFVNQKVLILGKGNSAFETAENLIPTAAVIHVASPRPVNFAWKTHFVGHLRAVNNNFLDTYQLKSQNAILDAQVCRLERGADGKIHVALRYTHAQQEEEVQVYDRVIACTGFRFDASIFAPECRPALTIDDRFPDQTSSWESVNVPDLFFLGTLTQMRDFKKTTSGFIHGFRYNIRALHRILEQRYHAQPWPAHLVPPGLDALRKALFDRINQTSALWQQFGFLCDLFVLDPAGGPTRHHEELPVAYVRDTELGRLPDIFVLTLEFGKVEGDPFSIQRFPDPAQAEKSVFLHPVVRHYVDGQLLSEHHVLEHLLGEWWDEALHIEPMGAYLASDSVRT